MGIDSHVLNAFRFVNILGVCPKATLHQINYPATFTNVNYPATFTIKKVSNIKSLSRDRAL